MGFCAALHPALRFCFPRFPLPGRENRPTAPTFWRSVSATQDGCGVVEARGLLCPVVEPTGLGCAAPGVRTPDNIGVAVGVSAIVVVMVVFPRSRRCTIMCTVGLVFRYGRDVAIEGGARRRCTAMPFPAFCYDASGRKPKAEGTVLLCVRSTWGLCRVLYVVGGCAVCVPCCIEWCRGALIRTPHENPFYFRYEEQNNRDQPTVATMVDHDCLVTIRINMNRSTKKCLNITF